MRLLSRSICRHQLSRGLDYFWLVVFVLEILRGTKVPALLSFSTSSSDSGTKFSPVNPSIQVLRPTFCGLASRCTFEPETVSPALVAVHPRIRLSSSSLSSVCLLPMTSRPGLRGDRPNGTMGEDGQDGGNDDEADGGQVAADSRRVDGNWHYYCYYRQCCCLSWHCWFLVGLKRKKLDLMMKKKETIELLFRNEGEKFAMKMNECVDGDYEGWNEDD